jgi:hypothetical protein
MDTRAAGRMGGKIGGRSRSSRKLRAVLDNLAKANAALAAKRRPCSGGLTDAEVKRVIAAAPRGVPKSDSHRAAIGAVLKASRSAAARAARLRGVPRPAALDSLVKERHFPRGRHSMKNIQVTMEGNILTIKVDLARESVPSSSGETIIIASTEGNIAVPEREEKVGLNVYRMK